MSIQEGFRNMGANAGNGERNADPEPFPNGFKNALEHQRNAMLFTLSQAAKEARISKSTLSKALARGRMTAVRREDGSFQIEASELFRVFPRKQEEQATPGEQEEQPERVEQPRGMEIAILRERLNSAQSLLNSAQGLLKKEQEERERERATWERERETILERERANAEDLRKRLDKAEEHIRLLKAPERPERAQEASVASAAVTQQPSAPKGRWWLLGR